MLADLFFDSHFGLGGRPAWLLSVTMASASARPCATSMSRVDDDCRRFYPTENVGSDGLAPVAVVDAAGRVPRRGNREALEYRCRRCRT
jgi:hypothetical protein